MTLATLGIEVANNGITDETVKFYAVPLPATLEFVDGALNDWLDPAADWYDPPVGLVPIDTITVLTSDPIPTWHEIDVPDGTVCILAVLDSWDDGIAPTNDDTSEIVTFRFKPSSAVDPAEYTEAGQTYRADEANPENGDPLVYGLEATSTHATYATAAAGDGTIGWSGQSTTHATGHRKGVVTPANKYRAWQMFIILNLPIVEEEEEPLNAGPFDQADYARGTPSHTFVSRRGGAAQPVVGDFRMVTRANGGLVACTGRVAQADVELAPNVLREESTWLVTVRELGKAAFKGHCKEPGFNAGIVDLAADGVGTELGAREFRTILYADDGLEHWTTLRDRRIKLHAAPDDPPDGYTIAGGAGNLTNGTYEYAVTFVTAEVESGLGPTVEIPVLIGESPANIHLRHIPTGDKAVTSRKIYRNDPGMGDNEFRLLTTINDNTTETYDDSTASVAANALAPAAATASPISASVDEGAMRLVVEPDEFVLAAQRGGFVWYVPVSDATAIRIYVEQNRSLDDWQLEISSGEEGSGPWVSEGTMSLAGEQAKKERFDFDNPGDVDTVRIELRRLTDGADSERVEIVIAPPRVYGAATDDDYSTSDVARDICRRLNISDGLVKPTGTPALPQLWTDGNFGAVLDFNSLLTEGGDYRWLMLIDGAKTLMDFGPSRRRRWILADPEVQPDLLPLPRFSRVKVYDHTGELLAEATADPNRLGFQRTAPAVRLPFRVSTLVAQRLAQALADYYVTRRWTGSVTIPRVWSLTGVPRSHFVVLGGDQLLVPRLQAFVTLDEVENTDQGYATATLPSTETYIDRLIARLEHGRAA